jgi:hypothetical protein
MRAVHFSGHEASISELLGITSAHLVMGPVNNASKTNRLNSRNAFGLQTSYALHDAAGYAYPDFSTWLTSASI